MVRSGNFIPTCLSTKTCRRFLMVVLGRYKLMKWVVKIKRHEVSSVPKEKIRQIIEKWNSSFTHHLSNLAISQLNFHDVRLRSESLQIENQCKAIFILSKTGIHAPEPVTWNQVLWTLLFRFSVPRLGTRVGSTLIPDKEIKWIKRRTVAVSTLWFLHIANNNVMTSCLLDMNHDTNQKFSKWTTITIFGTKTWTRKIYFVNVHC